MKRLILFIVSITLTHLMQAQCIPVHHEYLDGLKASALIGSGSDHWWDHRYYVNSDQGDYMVPAGSGHNAGFNNALWIGGYDPSGDLHVSANLYRDHGMNDWSSGPVRPSGIYDCEVAPELPLAPFSKGMIRMQNGKILVCYKNGFSVYNPGLHSITHYTLPIAKPIYSPVELKDGRIFLFGDNAVGIITPSLVMDTLTYAPVIACSLNFYHFQSVATVLPSGNVLITGVYGSEILDPITMTSSVVANPAVKRHSHETIVLPSGNVMVVAGAKTVSGGLMTNTTEIYDVASNTWSPGPSLSASRKEFALVQNTPTEYIIAGGTLATDEIEKLDIAGMTVNPGGVLPRRGTLAAGIKISSGEVMFVVNGLGYGGAQYDFVEYYNPATETCRANHNTFRGNALAPISGDLLLVQYYDTWLAEYDALKDELPLARYNKAWKMTRDQISQFLTDYAASAVDFTKYPNIETWPAHGNVAAGEPDNLAPFVDTDFDGMYNPLNGDYPCIIGETSIFNVYRDDGIHTQTEGTPMGVDVAQMSYNHPCFHPVCPDTLLEYATFYHYTITNRTTVDYHDVYVGLWIDPDLGDWWNDAIGCDTSLNMGFCWQTDTYDTAYGIPPAFGTMFLNTPHSLGMTHFVGEVFKPAPYDDIPDTFPNYYNLMRAVWKDGTQMVDNGGRGRSSVAPGPLTTHMMPGDAGFCGASPSGWNYASSGFTPEDAQYLQSVGPFDLAAGEQVELDMVAIFAQGTDNLNSVCRMKQAAGLIYNWWNSQTWGCLNLITENPGPQAGQPSQLFPNPSSGSFTLQLAKPLVATLQLGVYDLSGRKVASFTGMPGERDIQLDAPALPQGVYLLRTDAGEVSVSEKMMVVH